MVLRQRSYYTTAPLTEETCKGAAWKGGGGKGAAGSHGKGAASTGGGKGATEFAEHEANRCNLQENRWQAGAEWPAAMPPGSGRVPQPRPMPRRPDPGKGAASKGGGSKGAALPAQTVVPPRPPPPPPPPQVMSQHAKSGGKGKSPGGEPVCIFEGMYCPQILVCGANWVNTDSLESRRISVVVNCRGKKDDLMRQCAQAAGCTWVTAAVWAASPEAQYDQVAIMRMCLEIDNSVRHGGSVMFYCSAGRHRSFAAAVSYILWIVRTSYMKDIVDKARQCDERFELMYSVTEARGRPRRPLGQDLIQWESYLRRGFSHEARAA